jgi:hypothetical protein
MATRKLKLTGFARFFIVMLFLVPIAYLGAAYYNGQDGIQNIKNLFGIDQKKPATEQVAVNQNPQTVAEDSAISNTNRGGSVDSRRIDQLELRMNQLERENARLKEQIRQQDLKIKELQR